MRWQADRVKVGRWCRPQGSPVQANPSLRKDIALTTSALPATPIDLDAANRQLADADAQRIIRWARETFGEGLAMTSSFGAQAAVMLHLVTRIVPDIPVIFIDTGYLFAETYHFAEQLRRRLNLNLHIYQPEMSPARMEAVYGRLWEKGLEGLNRYDQIRKVEPMQRALRELNVTAWLAGVRGDQTEHRAALRIVEKSTEVYKVHPILSWHRQDVDRYIKDHDLPLHPLVAKGYTSIGDRHSTRPVKTGEDERAGRFRGLKTECGLHLPQTVEEAQSRDGSGL